MVGDPAESPSTVVNGSGDMEVRVRALSLTNPGPFGPAGLILVRLLGPPSRVSVSATCQDSVSLDWEHVEGAEEYMVDAFRGDGSVSVGDAPVWSDRCRSTSVDVSGIDAGVHHTFVVRSGALGTFESVGGKVVGAALAPPGSVGASCDNGVVTLEWGSVEGAEHYLIESADFTGGNREFGDPLSDPVGASPFVADSLEPGSLVALRVRSGLGDVFEAVGAETDVAVLIAPTGLQVSRVSRSAVSVSWEAVRGATHYRVERWREPAGRTVLLVSGRLSVQQWLPFPPRCLVSFLVSPPCSGYDRWRSPLARWNVLEPGSRWCRWGRWQAHESNT